MSMDKILKSLEIEKLLLAAEEDSIEDMVYDTMRKLEENTPSGENFFLPMKLLDEYHNSEVIWETVIMAERNFFCENASIFYCLAYYK